MESLIPIAIAVLFVAFIYTRLAPVKGLRTLGSAEFKKQLNQHPKKALIDVREPGEFRAGSIRGAVNIPLSQLGARWSEIPRDQSVYLFCQSGIRSKQAARVLSKQGFADLTHLQGGYMSWER